MVATHFLFGMLGGLVISAAVVAVYRRWIYWTPLFVGLCGVCAEAPDLLGRAASVSPVIRNLFFGHALIEAHVPAHEFWALGAVVVLFNFLIAAQVAAVVLYLRPRLERPLTKRRVKRRRPRRPEESHSESPGGLRAGG